MFPVYDDISLISKTEVAGLPQAIVIHQKQLTFNTDLPLFSNMH